MSARQPREQFLDADAFLDALQNNQPEKVEGKRVKGAVILRGAVVDVPVRALYVFFEGEVDFSDTAFERGLDLSGCTFAKTLSLRNIDVNGDLTLDDVRVRDLPSLWRKRLDDSVTFNLAGARVSGDLLVTRSVIAGAFAASRMEIGGSLTIQGSEIDGTTTISGTTIDGTLALGWWTSSDAAGTVNPTVRQGVFNESVLADNLRVRGPVRLVAVQIEGNLSLWGGNFESSILASPLGIRVQKGSDEAKWQIVGEMVIRYNLDLTASRVEGYVQLESVRVGGTLVAASLNCNFLAVRPLTRPSLVGPPCEVGRLDLTGASVADDVQLTMIRVTGGPAVPGIQGIGIRDASIGGSLRFWTQRALSSEWEAEPPPERDPLAAGAVVWGDLEITRTTIRGDCQFTNLWASGVIRVDHSRVHGDIAFRSRESLLGSKLTEEGLRKRLTESGVALLRARAVALDLRMTRCESAIDLTGLDLVTEGRIAQDLPAGSIAAQSVFAAGEIVLCVDGEAATIPGSANFEGAETARFVASTHSFDADTAREEDLLEIGLILARARIGELCLHATHAAQNLRFPVPVDLDDLTVRVWNLGGDRGDARRFQALLRSDPVFRRDTFVRIEQHLRNGGHEQAAVRIYKDMWREERRQKWKDVRKAPTLRERFARSFLLSLGSPFHTAFRFMGFGTAPLRLLVVILLVWGTLLFAYYEPANFEQSLPERIARGNQGPATPPPPREWEGVTPLFASIRYHIPIVGLIGREEYDLADTGRMRWRWLGDTYRSTIPWSPEDWGLAIALLNWLLWPPFVTFVGRKLLR